MMYRTTRLFLASLLIGCASIASAQTEWKAKTREGGYSLSSVVFTGKGWVVLGNHGLVMTSSDGDTWLNASTEDTKPMGFLAVAWSGKTLVAAGYGEGPHFAEGAVIASADGKNWTDTAYSAATLRALTWGGDQFVAVGDGGGLLTSPDGSKWTIHARLPRGYLSGIAWNGSRYVAVGYGGAILVSSDAEKWSEKVSPAKTVLTSVTWTGKRWVVVGDSGAALHSLDGETWTEGKTGVKKWLNSVVWTGGQLVAVGESGVVLVSQDGSEWQPKESGTHQNLYAVAVHGNTLIAVGESNTILASTVDASAIRAPARVRRWKQGYTCRFQGSRMMVLSEAGGRARRESYTVHGIRFSGLPSESDY